MAQETGKDIGNLPAAALPSSRESPYPVLVVDQAGSVVGVNQPASELFGRAAVGDMLRDVVPRWLSDAHDDHTGSCADAPLSMAPATAVAGTVGDHSFAAHPTRRATDDSVVWWLTDDTERTSIQRALDIERRRTAFLAEASSLLLSSLNADRCMEVTAQLAAQHLCDAAVVIAPPTGSRFPITLSTAAGEATHHRWAINPTTIPGLSEALRGFPPAPSQWIDPHTIPDFLVPDGFGDIGSVAVVPLPGQGIPAGALLLLRRTGSGGFSASEEIFAGLFAARAGAALAAARMYADQTAIAESLLRELLPPKLHQVHGVDFAGAYRTSQSSDLVGGDFYDVHPGTDADAETLAVLGDVCGKGLDAAVLTGKIRTSLAALLPIAADHKRTLNLLNSALLGAHTRFATMVLASVQRHGAQVRLRLTAAGHLPPLIVRNDGQVEQVDTSGTLVGVLPEVEAVTADTELAPGEICVLYTDGITEARGGPLGEEQFGEQRLQRALAGCAGMPAEAVTEHIQMLAQQWANPATSGPADDMAVLAITAPRTTHLSAVGGHTRGRYTA